MFILMVMDHIDSQPQATPAPAEPAPMQSVHAEAAAQLKAEAEAKTGSVSAPAAATPTATPGLNPDGSVTLAPNEVKDVQDAIAYAQQIEHQNRQYKAMIQEMRAKGATPAQAQQVAATVDATNDQVRTGAITADDQKRIIAEAVRESLGAMQNENAWAKYQQDINQFVLDNCQIQGSPQQTLQNIHIVADTYIKQGAAPQEAYRMAISMLPAKPQTAQPTTQTTQQTPVSPTLAGAPPVKGMPDVSNQVSQTPGGVTALELKRNQVAQLEAQVSKTHSEIDRRKFTDAFLELRAMEKNQK